MLFEKYKGTLKGKPISLEVYYDPSPMNPRKDDNLGTMLCFHSRYDLGDKNILDINTSMFDSWEDMEEYLRKEENAVVILPLFLYDHGGITMKTLPFSCHWDSGQVGFIYVTREKILKDFKRKKLSKKLLKFVADILLSEVEIYKKYLEGDIYGYILKENGEDIDSCWGFYGHNIRENGILEYIPEEYRQTLEL